jgi:hypothetical protein
MSCVCVCVWRYDGLGLSIGLVLREMLPKRVVWDSFRYDMRHFQLGTLDAPTELQLPEAQHSVWHVPSIERRAFACEGGSLKALLDTGHDGVPAQGPAASQCSGPHVRWLALIRTASGEGARM